MMYSKKIALIVALIAAAPALAHHSYAMFDRTKSMPLSGMVTAWEWGNPHVWMALKTDRNVEWRIEMRSTGELGRQGLRSIDIKPGDRISLTVFPARNGKPIASLSHGVLANGKNFGELRADAIQ